MFLEDFVLDVENVYFLVEFGVVKVYLFDDVVFFGLFELVVL